MGTEGEDDEQPNANPGKVPPPPPPPPSSPDKAEASTTPGQGTKKTTREQAIETLIQQANRKLEAQYIQQEAFNPDDQDNLAIEDLLSTKEDSLDSKNLSISEKAALVEAVRSKRGNTDANQDPSTRQLVGPRMSAAQKESNVLVENARKKIVALLTQISQIESPKSLDTMDESWLQLGLKPLFESKKCLYRLRLADAALSKMDPNNLEPLQGIISFATPPKNILANLTDAPDSNAKKTIFTNWLTTTLQTQTYHMTNLTHEALARAHTSLKAEKQILEYLYKYIQPGTDKEQLEQAFSAPQQTQESYRSSTPPEPKNPMRRNYTLEDLNKDRQLKESDSHYGTVIDAQASRVEVPGAAEKQVFDASENNSIENTTDALLTATAGVVVSKQGVTQKETEELKSAPQLQKAAKEGAEKIIETPTSSRKHTIHKVLVALITMCLIMLATSMNQKGRFGGDHDFGEM